MLFNSLSYLFFLPVVLGLFYVVPKQWRYVLLLLASYFFYMSWLPVYGILLFVLSTVNYGLGLAIHHFEKVRKPLLVSGLILNLGTLCFYKYALFLISNWNQVLQVLEKKCHLSTAALHGPELSIILPLGISFFVFEFIHYLVDVYKGDRPLKDFVQFSLFSAFFPSQIAGPIKRYQDFRKQLDAPVPLDVDRFWAGLERILQGLFKKMALSDNLAPLVEVGFQHSSTIGTYDAWVSAIAFTLQIYFDFSGYTDIGIGSAKLFGIDLPENFNLPYVASSLTDFWKRWHISLSSWLRDYLYIPLGGGRCNPLRKHMNLVATMLLGGLWHGAAWQYVVWGGFHGLGLVANHSFDQVSKSDNKVGSVIQSFNKNAASKYVYWFSTLLFVVIGWVFFRANSLWEAIKVLKHMFSWAPSTVLQESLDASPVAVAFALYFVFLAWRYLTAVEPVNFAKRVNQFLFAQPLPRACVCLASLIAAVAFAPAKVSAFIYFQF